MRRSMPWLGMLIEAGARIPYQTPIPSIRGPLQVDCPRCEAPTGQPCDALGLARHQTYHRARVEFARRSQKAP